MSYTRCLYHIIFRTKYSEMTIPIGPDESLYKYISGFIRNKKCVLYNINGMPDHLHICTSLASNISLSDFVKDIKLSSSYWIKTKRDLFPFFRG
ncbi:MAG: transposase [Victivallales bacterium]|nr:transposase [Victivallales bacterium]